MAKDLGLGGFAGGVAIEFIGGGGVSFGVSHANGGRAWWLDDLAYLSGTGKYIERREYSFPDLVLLDLNIPRLNGMEVLRWIRKQPQLLSVPVVIFTSSEEPQDMEQGRALGANDYLVKPSGMEKTISTVKTISQRWLQA